MEFRLPYLLSHGRMICFFRKFNLLFLYYYYFFYLCNGSADLMFLLDKCVVLSLLAHFHSVETLFWKAEKEL